MNVPSISARELGELAKNGQPVELVDVRTPAEFEEVHIEFARNEPLDRLDPARWQNGNSGQPGKPLFVICKSGSRGRQACEKLLQAGVSNVFNVEGGTMAGVEAGLPIVRGKKTISLERQVRIGAGSFVLLGLLLAYFVHPVFVGLSACVGAGLVFAGITDTCGMAMLLAKMPWNQSAASSRS